jgi:glutamate-1-semialdehyde 2,1-aminomutase
MTDFASVKRSDTGRYAGFFHAMRERGIFLPPAQFEAWFLSTAHGDSDLRRTARAAGESLAEAFAGAD